MAEDSPLTGMLKKKASDRLSTTQRAKMPKGEFAGPGHSFPINDPTHARLAISGATRSERAGNISPSTEASIKAKARAKLGDDPGDHEYR